jgi:hypothetical protein
MSLSKEAKHNQRVHISALAATKLGDGLLDPKLVLAWLMNSLGVGAAWIGWLVPLREAGSTLPQLITAQRLRRVSIRKWWWVGGSIVQGVAVLGVVHTAFTLTGTAAGQAMLLYVALFAVARSICSVSYKDVLGKTVDKPYRGQVTGTAAALAAGGVLLFGVILLFEFVERQSLVLSALAGASALWFLAAGRFAALSEAPSEVRGAQTERVWLTYWRYLTDDRELQKFLVVRGLLTATAITPPFLLLLADQSETKVLEVLGGLVIASSLATFLSGRIWGRLSDYSTRLVLGWAGLAAAGMLMVALLGVRWGIYDWWWFLPGVLFGVMVSYQGVRIARTVHLVNLATEETRAAYTAISNTIIGLILLGTGGFGWLAASVGVNVVIVTLSVMSVFGGLLAFTLRD